MADEITLVSSLRVAKSSLSIEKRQATQRVDMAGTDYSAGTQSIPTTAGGTAVTVAAAVGTPGISRFTNTDATNYVELGRQVAGSFYVFVKLLPGEWFDFRLGCTTAQLFALANTSAVTLEHIIVEA
jgi:hypothetical protein